MLHPTQWTVDPRYYPPCYLMNAAYPMTYSYNPSLYYGPMTYCCYPQPSMPYPINNSSYGPNYPACMSTARLNQTFRTLWEQHVFWTRELIISIAMDLPDQPQVTERLLRNVPDMADVFRNYYGNDIATQFSKLFKEHLILAAQLVQESKAGNSQVAAETEKKWLP